MERTCWEKLTILHKLAHFPEGKVLPSRYARHLYDVRKHVFEKRQEFLRDLFKNCHNYATITNPTKSDFERAHAGSEFLNFINKCAHRTYQ